MTMKIEIKAFLCSVSKLDPSTKFGGSLNPLLNALLNASLISHMLNDVVALADIQRVKKRDVAPVQV